MKPMGVRPHCSWLLKEMPVCGWAPVAGPEVSRGATCMGTRPRKMRLSRERGVKQLPPASFRELYQAPAMCQALCLALGTQRPQGRVLHPGAQGLGRRP